MTTRCYAPLSLCVHFHLSLSATAAPPPPVTLAQFIGWPGSRRRPQPRVAGGPRLRRRHHRRPRHRARRVCRQSGVRDGVRGAPNLPLHHLDAQSAGQVSVGNWTRHFEQVSNMSGMLHGIGRPSASRVHFFPGHLFPDHRSPNKPVANVRGPDTRVCVPRGLQRQHVLHRRECLCPVQILLELR